MRRSIWQAIRRITAFAMTAGVAMPAFSHESNHAVMSFAAGFAHPFFGLDHLLAMLAVGLWAAQYKRPATWVLPLVFLAAMGLGALLGTTAGFMPAIEMGVAGSVAVLGLLIAFAIRMPMWASAALVSLFALVHGHAHGTELPQSGFSAMHVAGLVAATAVLQLLGLAVGRFAIDKNAFNTMRWSGAGIAVAGAALVAVAV
jgi:urease accessory protein